MLCDDERFDEALGVIEQARPSEGCCADLLVWKAKCLQLGDHATLDEVEGTLRDAIACDEENVDAWGELGWFLLNVRDQAEKAQEAFVRALRIQAKANTEVLIGLVKCAKEINPNKSSDELKRSLVAGLVDVNEVDAALSE
jgi:tetratricopeptide (TPR) repeat protein